MVDENNKKCLTFNEWRKQGQGKSIWYESPVIIDQLTVNKDTLSRASQEMAYAIIRQLFLSGGGLDLPTVDSRKFPELHTWQLSANVKTEFQGAPEQYLQMAYEEWVYAVQAWESKSLWEYLRHWIKRTLHRSVN